MELTDCTSLNCISRDSAYCPKCSHARYLGEGTDHNGKLWRWEFNSMFGPLFLRKDGMPLVHQPIPLECEPENEHPAWQVFLEWQKNELP